MRLEGGFCEADGVADAVVTGAERLVGICAFDFSAGEGAHLGLEGVGELSGDGCGWFF